MMEDWLTTGVDEVEITCNWNEDTDTFQWEGEFPDCQRVCSALIGTTGDDEITPTYNCTDGFKEHSKCTKVCPEGYKLQSPRKPGWESQRGGTDSKTCKVRNGYSQWWSGNERARANWKNCVKKRKDD